MRVGSKPCLAFVGEDWEKMDDFKVLKSLFMGEWFCHATIVAGGVPRRRSYPCVCVFVFCCADFALHCMRDQQTISAEKCSII